MKKLSMILIIVGILILIDIYAFKSLRLLISTTNKTEWKWFLYSLYGFSTLITYGILIFIHFNFTRDVNALVNPYYIFLGFGILVLILLPKLIVTIFHLLDDLIHLIKHVVYFLIRRPVTANESGDIMTRWEFLTKVGWFLSIVPFAGTLYGMLYGRFAFRVVKKKISFPNFPASANGLRIVQISDTHLGSFYRNKKQVQKGFDLVKSLNPDIIVFTGDMVNNATHETRGFEEIFKTLRSRYGNYSVLGNHDYGDYVDWPSRSAKKENLDQLIDFQEKAGFKVLLNEMVEFKTDSGEIIEIIGVENWGANGFTKYGDLSKALRNSNPNNFQILLSHDPSHWEAQVMGKTEIDLTLSGHTHGMQFGVEIPGVMKWSPAQYRYKRWGGLYQEGKQKLYVNRGFGYIGFPGRVGMPPEITLLELYKS